MSATRRQIRIGSANPAVRTRKASAPIYTREQHSNVRYRYSVRQLVKIIERLTKVIEKEVPETQLMAAMGLVLTVANSYDEDRLDPVFKSFRGAVPG